MRSFPLLLLALVSVACATQQPGAVQDALPLTPETATYVRTVTGIPVVNANGEPYAFPFLGGLNVPRPQAIDIDGDADLDLFLQEASGRIMFFENTGTPEVSAFVWRTDQFHDLDVGEWFRLLDMDRDGDYDILAEQRYSFITYFENTGTAQSATFVTAIDTLFDVNGDPIFADRQNIPTVADVDCDGRADLFLGRVTGTMDRYEAVSDSPDDALRFRFVQERFEDIEIVNAFTPSLHGANTLQFADHDADGDLDLFWGDFFEPGLLLIENTTDDCSTPNLRNEPLSFPPNAPISTSGYNAPFLADMDSDGDLDLLLGILGGAFNPNRTSRDNLYYYEHVSADVYTLQSRRVLNGIDVGNESVPVFADLDSDGDLDLLLSNKIDQSDLDTGHMYHFENTGTATAPAFALRGRLELPPAFHYVPALGDLDGDGDLDMLLGTWEDALPYLRNDGTPEAPNFVLQSDAFVTLTRGSNSVPHLADMDADGDLDLFIGESSGAINYYRNDGTPAAPTFTFVSDKYQGMDAGRRSFPFTLDIDADGDLDLIVGTDASGLKLYRNTGTPTEAVFVEDGTLEVPTPNLVAPAFVDIDGDGNLELFLGGLGGGITFFEAQ